ncbi:AbrB/MazE/SpoVT family DNA-binding domain-containing protein [Syntrophobacteraceae bacterium DRH4]|nr:AbrB/MazE/SpoVT family DNA-binding domain-containing protein [Desulfoferrobacter suflitae]MCK8601995.1 AbrB/MazE/SpoVT family DNA-binding domain-containing protein [Desulfoferrobacter suflitae]
MRSNIAVNGDTEVMKMQALKVRKIGNSLGLVLPKEVLARLKVEEGDTIYLTDAEDGYRITPMDVNFAKQMAAAEAIMREDRAVLRELSKR